MSTNRGRNPRCSKKSATLFARPPPSSVIQNSPPAARDKGCSPASGANGCVGKAYRRRVGGLEECDDGSAEWKPFVIRGGLSATASWLSVALTSKGFDSELPETWEGEAPAEPLSPNIARQDPRSPDAVCERKSTTCRSVRKVPRCSDLTTGACGSLSCKAEKISTRLMESMPRSESSSMSNSSISAG